MSNKEEETLQDEGMTFWEHLAELRTRMLRMAMAAAAGATGAWFYREEILQWLLVPFQEAWVAHFKEEAKIIFTGPADLFLNYLKLSVIAGILVALPIIFYQLWAFIAPGLYKSEKRYAIPFVVSSTGLFVAGAYLGMRFAFPVAFAYLLGFATPTVEAPPAEPAATVQTSPSSSASISPSANPAPAGPGEVQIHTATPGDASVIRRQKRVLIEANIRVDDYIGFISRMLLAFGAVFELPVVVFFLSVAGIVNHKHLIKFYRYFIVIAFGVAAVITPPDLLSQFMLAVPMVLLYTVSIGIAYIFGKKTPVLPVPS